MAYNYGFVGLTSVSSAGAVDGGNVIRIFDVAFGATSAAAAAIILKEGSLASTGTERMQIPVAVWAFNSNAGIRFDKGCYCIATGCTATISFTREF